MKKYFLIFILITSGFALSAQDAAAGEDASREDGGFFKKAGGAVAGYFTNEKGDTNHLVPYRLTTMSGFFVMSGFSFSVADNFLIGPADIFGKNSSRRKDGWLNINLDEIENNRVIKKDGLDFHFGFNWGGEQGMLFRLDKFHKMENDTPDTGIDARYSGWGFTLLKNIDMNFDFNFSSGLMLLLANGLAENEETDSGFTASGSVFVETLQVRLYKQWLKNDNSFFNKWFLSRLTVSLAPSHFIPLVYLPRSDIGLKIKNTSSETSAELTGNLLLYTAFNPDNPSELSMAGGFDLNAGAEYHIFPILDAGLNITHIPVIPAHMSYGMLYKLEGTIYRGKGLVDALAGDSIKMPSLGNSEGVSESLWVMRPMRWDFYALLRPLRSDLIVLRPNIGWTTLLASKEAAFNIGIEADLNIGRWFTLEFFTGAYDLMSHNRLGLNFHWKRFGAFIDVDMVSQDYLYSWTLKGAQISAGWESGW